MTENLEPATLTTIRAEINQAASGVVPTDAESAARLDALDRRGYAEVVSANEVKNEEQKKRIKRMIEIEEFGGETDGIFTVRRATDAAQAGHIAVQHDVQRNK